jgi:hypothetical protein
MKNMYTALSTHTQNEKSKNNSHFDTHTQNEKSKNNSHTMAIRTHQHCSLQTGPPFAIFSRHKHARRKKWKLHGHGNQPDGVLLNDETLLKLSVSEIKAAEKFDSQAYRVQMEGDLQTDCAARRKRYPNSRFRGMLEISNLLRSWLKKCRQEQPTYVIGLLALRAKQSQGQAWVRKPRTTETKPGLNKVAKSQKLCIPKKGANIKILAFPLGSDESRSNALRGKEWSMPSWQSSLQDLANVRFLEQIDKQTRASEWNLSNIIVGMLAVLLFNQPGKGRTQTLIKLWNRLVCQPWANPRAT